MKIDIPNYDCEVIEGKPRLYCTKDGKFPSVTSVLSVLSKGDNTLEKWRKRVGEEEADKITKSSSDRGNKLHEYAELYLNNALERSYMTGTARLMFNRCKDYYDKIIAVAATETVLYSKKHKYAGRVDAIVVINNRITVLDHKNSRKSFNLSMSWSRKKLFKYLLQCTAYAIAFEEMYGIRIDQGSLIIANYDKSNAQQILFDIDDYLRVEFLKIVGIYYGKTEKKESQYFKL